MPIGLVAEADWIETRLNAGQLSAFDFALERRKLICWPSFFFNLNLQTNQKFHWNFITLALAEKRSYKIADFNSIGEQIDG